MMRQVAGAFAEYEKRRLVAKLRAARERKAAAGGKAYGRYGYEREAPQALAAARELRAQGLSLRAISAEHGTARLVTLGGKPYRPNSILKMVGTAR